MAFKKKYPKRRYKKKAPGTKKVARVVKKMDQFKITSRYVPSLQQLFPDRLFTKMRNFFIQSFTATTGAITAGGILGNALHNPIAASTTGTNALNYSSASSMVGLAQILGAGGSATTYAYSNYRIHGSSMRIQIQSDVNGAIPGQLVLFPTSEETTLGNVAGFNLQTLQEYPYSKTVHVGGITMNRGVTLKSFMSTAKMYGLKYKSAIEDPAYTGAGGTNPANQWGWVWAWFPDVATTASVTLNVEIIYTIEFVNRSLQNLGSG